MREQLNAALASGQELDANTKALIEEAKKNGVTILADPMVESVAVQKDMLKELRGMNHAGGGAPDQAFASGSRGLRLVKRDMLAQIHAGEDFLVVPRDVMGRPSSFGSFARGSDREGGGQVFERRQVPMVVPEGTSSGTTTSTGGGAGVHQGAIESAVNAAVEGATPINVTHAPTIQILDNSQVRTLEGQRPPSRRRTSLPQPDTR